VMGYLGKTSSFGTDEAATDRMVSIRAQAVDLTRVIDLGQQATGCLADTTIS